MVKRHCYLSTLDLVELEILCASHIKNAIWDCFLKNGFTNELL